MNIKEGKGNSILLIIVAIATLLVAVVGTTFAYFTAVLSNKETVTTIKVSSGTVGTVFDGGSVITVPDIFPRTESWATKTFSIKFISSAPDGTQFPYTLGMVIDENQFEATYLKYTFSKDASSSNNGTFAPDIIAQTNIPLTGTVALGGGKFVAPTGGEVIHTYKIDIFFPDNGTIQNVSHGKIFKAHVVIDLPNT